MASSLLRKKIVAVTLTAAAIAVPVTQAGLKAKSGARNSKPTVAVQTAPGSPPRCLDGLLHAWFVPIRCSSGVFVHVPTPQAVAAGFPTLEALASYERAVSAAGIYGNVPTLQYLAAVRSLAARPPSTSYAQAVAAAGIYGNVPTQQYLAAIADGH